ncbi:MAG: hypothetical protein M0Z27_01835 [Thermaerobacter sp.]|nr:hypothetical protein [Thermaerobacter sp.]
MRLWIMLLSLLVLGGLVSFLLLRPAAPAVPTGGHFVLHSAGGGGENTVWRT